MTALLAALFGTLFIASAIVVWGRPVAFWVSVAGLGAGTLVILITAGQTQVADFLVVYAFVLLGPTAVVLSVLRLRVLTRNVFLAVVSAVVVFFCSAALWLLVAYNVGAIQP